MLQLGSKPVVHDGVAVGTLVVVVLLSCFLSMHEGEAFDNAGGGGGGEGGGGGQ